MDGYHWEDYSGCPPHGNALHPSWDGPDGGYLQAWSPLTGGAASQPFIIDAYNYVLGCDPGECVSETTTTTTEPGETTTTTTVAGPTTLPEPTVPPEALEDWVPGGQYFVAGGLVGLLLVVWGLARPPKGVTGGGEF